MRLAGARQRRRWAILTPPLRGGDGMPVVGDRVEVLPSKGGQVPRRGLVTGLSGSLITVRWDSGEETRLVPGPGAMRVVDSGQGRVAAPRRRTSSPSGT